MIKNTCTSNLNACYARKISKKNLKSTRKKLKCCHTIYTWNNATIIAKFELTPHKMWYEIENKTQTNAKGIA